ncbi:radical SAM protein [bacterium]|nr:radical SAM protein [bacterium]
MTFRQNSSGWTRERIISFHSRLLNQELGKKELKKSALVKAVVVFPNTYGVGMANMGFHTVYRFFNEHPGMSCERAFFDKMYERKQVLSLESSKPLNNFDLIGFSVSFELDIINIIRILVLSKIALLSSNRTKHDPVIIAGGPVTGLNPSPLLPFVDGLLMGDGEEVFRLIGDVMTEAKENHLSRADILETLSMLPGMYVEGRTKKVTRQVLLNLDKYPTYTPIVSSRSHFKNMFVTELSRGCPRKCKFCAAREIYKPFRYRSHETIIGSIKEFNPGAKRIGLEGSAVSDYPKLTDLCEKILDMGYDISFSSIRADKITEAMQDVVKRSRLRTFTIAPEAGSERLRYLIGKKIADSEILKGVEKLAYTEVRILKLYFMIGLPEEKDDDAEAIADLTNRIQKIFSGSNKGKQVHLSINTFIPKPFTPFESEPVARERDLVRRRNIVKKRIDKKIHVSAKSSKRDILQSVLALGNRETGLALMDSIQQGITWKEALINRDIFLDEMIFTGRDKSAIKEWDFID